MTTHQPERPEAGIIGRTLRLMLGVLFGWMTYNVMRFEDSADNLQIVAIFAAVTAVYGLLHVIISRYSTDLHRWFGAIVVVVPTILLFAFGGAFGQVASVAYVGLSFLVQAFRGDGGCEVLAVPSIVLGHRTHLMGILFAPIDWVEKQLTGPGGLPG